MYPHPAVIIYFYPRPLRGGRRAKAAIEDADEIFLSTPSARRATHELDHGQRAQVISIHALCEEGDGAGLLLSTCKQLFLSTPSARRATTHSEALTWSGYDFYPRPLRGGRPFSATVTTALANFYPRPLRGGRPEWVQTLQTSFEISIHALCEEGDVQHG